MKEVISTLTFGRGTFLTTGHSLSHVEFLVRQWHSTFATGEASLVIIVSIEGDIFSIDWFGTYIAIG